MSDVDIVRRLLALDRRLSRLETAGAGYEVGTYTPTYLGQTSAGVTTYSLQTGAYVRLGSLVVATGTLVWTAATGTGNAVISLPFTSANVTNQNYSGTARLDGVTFANSTPEVQVGSNQAFFTLRSPLTNASPTVVQVEAAGNVIFTVVYFV